MKLSESTIWTPEERAIVEQDTMLTRHLLEEQASAGKTVQQKDGSPLADGRIGETVRFHRPIGTFTTV